MVSPSGNAINPQITWSPVAAAKSYVYVHDDPGCPNDPCVHWVIVDIPANVNKIDRDVKNQPPGTPLRNYAGNCPGGPPGNVGSASASALVMFILVRVRVLLRCLFVFSFVLLLR
jgi:hypothetical protein